LLELHSAAKEKMAQPDELLKVARDLATIKRQVA
jgi:hypothetical protein